MWQQDFNNTITQTNSGLAGGIPRLGESPHPLAVLQGEKSLRLTARGNSTRTCEAGMDKTFGNISRSRDAQNAALAWW